MLKFKKIIIIIFIILFSGSLYPETNENVCPQKKDPFIAGLLSVTMMGLGHFYTKDYLMGSMFILTDFVQKGLLIFLVMNLNDKYTDEDDDVVRWTELTDGDKGVVVGFIAFYFGSRIYCIVDAMNSAKRYNKRLDEEFAKTGLRLRYSITHRSVGIGLSKNF